GYIQKAPLLYEKIIAAITPTEIFLSSHKDIWLHALKNLNAQEINLVNETIEEIFLTPESITTKLDISLFQELIKRMFLKFLKTEINNIRLNLKKRFGILREHTFSIKLNNLAITGRVDSF